MLNQFLDYLKYELNRSPLTLDAYKRDISQFCEWISPNDPEGTDFASVTSSDIRTWLASLARSGEKARTLRRKIISLRMLFKWMMKTGKITQSPLDDVALPKIPKPLPDLVKPEEIERALITLQENKTGEDNFEEELRSLIVELLYSLGIRRAELIGLNDSDISFTKGEVKVTGKRNKQRIIPVPERLLAKIKKWQQLRDIQNNEWSDNEKPLLTVKGKRISPEQVYTRVKDVLQNSTAKKKSPHALRHSFASGMLNGGADIDSVREFLGHESLATTQIYTHISLQEIKRIYNISHPRSKTDPEN